MTTTNTTAAKPSTNAPGIVKRSNAYNIDPHRITTREGWNNRFEYGDIAALADGIAETLKRQPGRPFASDIEVKRIYAPDPRAEQFDFEVIAGHRRHAATQLLLERGVEFPEGVNAHIIDRKQTDLESTIQMFNENNAKALLPLEEAAALKRLRDGGLTIEEVCKVVGRAHVHVVATLALLEADESLQEAVKQKKVGGTMAKKIAVAARGDKATQAALTKQAVAAGKDNKARRRVMDQVEQVRAQKAAAKGKTLKMRALSDDQLSEIGAKVAKHLEVVMKEAKLAPDTDLLARIKKDEHLVVAFTLGALEALKAAAGAKVNLEL